MFRPVALMAVAAFLAACTAVPTGPATGSNATPAAPGPVTRAAVERFRAVVSRIEPVSERYCREQTSGVNCDFQIVIDNRPGQPVNAYQTLDENGRPILAFTLAMLSAVSNEDELAFVMGHEASHHLLGHIARQQQNAVTGAVLAGLAATLAGAGDAGIREAQRAGAQVGARSYSKEHELEADALGTRITAIAGFDPVRGAAFFSRIPDPGDRFLGTHPANAERIAVVRQTAASL